jgi:hypothetical protein
MEPTTPVEELRAAAALLREPDQKHVAPALVEPLAAWLDATADEYEREPCDDPTGVCNRCEFDPSVLPALTLAAEILGRQP